MKKQYYINRAETCLRGIEKIKQEINKCETEEKKRELAVKYMEDLKILERTYNEARAMYDPNYKKNMEE